MPASPSASLKIRFIQNPRSGALRRQPGISGEIERFIAAHRLDASLVSTERAGHATELAARAVAESCAVVAAVGGDGTMNEVARALVRTRSALGLIPCGSGNGLARHLRLPRRVAAALEVLLSGRPRAIDSGLINGHPFFSAAGLGFEARIAHVFNQGGPRGFFSYLRLSASAFRQHQPEVYRISVNGATTEVKAFTLAVANSDQYGNNARIAPRAQADDGLLDLVAVPPITAFNAAPLVLRLFLGTLDRASSVTRRRGAHFLIQRSAPGLIHTDGETHETGVEIEVRLQPRSLKIMAPATGPWSPAA